jgi:uncharacterized protein
MRNTLFSLIFSAFAASSAWAEIPTAESVENLLKLEEIDRTPALVQEQLGEMTNNTIQQVTIGRNVTSDEEKIIKTFAQKSDAVQAELEERLGFERMKAEYIRFYRDTFTQEEVDQLIQFYQTPLGKMLATKMPLVNQHAMRLIQQNMAPSLRRLQQAANEMKQQLTALRTTKPPMQTEQTVRPAQPIQPAQSTQTPVQPQ